MKKAIRDRIGGGLNRRPPSKKPKKSFYLFCEGKNTEPLYFEALKKGDLVAQVRIEIVGGVGDPLSLFKRANKKKRAIAGGNKGSFSKEDQFWIVFDRDEHCQVQDAMRLAESSGMGVAFSNPCFEVWLVYHLEDYDKICCRYDVQDHLRKLHPKYNPSSSKVPDYSEIMKGIDDAERRAKKSVQKRVEEGRPLSAPCSTVYRLTKQVRGLPDK